MFCDSHSDYNFKTHKFLSWGRCAWRRKYNGDKSWQTIASYGPRTEVDEEKKIFFPIFFPLLNTALCDEIGRNKFNVQRGMQTACKYFFFLNFITIFLKADGLVINDVIVCWSMRKFFFFSYSICVRKWLKKTVVCLWATLQLSQLI